MKSISKILFLFILLLLLLGCSASKKKTDKERIRIIKDTILIHDSIYITKNKIILLPSVNTEIIQNPCDEYGKLKPILENIKFPYGSVNINSENGNLKVQVNTDSINSVYQNQYVARYNKQVQKITDLQKEITKTTRERSIWKYIAVFFILISMLLFLLINGKYLYNKIKAKM